MALQCAQTAVFALSLFGALHVPCEPLAWIALGLIQNLLWWLAFALSDRPSRLYPLLACAALTTLVLSRWQSPFETDFYRYEWDARALLSGINPYATPPSQSGFAPELVARINYPELATVYSPLAVVGFVFSWVIGKLTSLGFLAGLRLLLFGSAWLALRPYPTRWIWLLHPLLLREGLAQAHYDVWLGAFLLWALPKVSQAGRARGVGWGVLASQLKLPGVLLAALGGRGGPVLGVTLACGTIAAAAGLASGHLSGSLHSLLRFGTEWEANSGVVRWLRDGLMDSGLFPDFASASGAARMGGAALGALLCALLWLRPVPQRVRAFWIYFLLAWLSPASNAWYFLWALMLVPALETGLPGFRPALWASALFVLLPLADAHWLHHYALAPGAMPWSEWLRDEIGIARIWDLEHGLVALGVAGGYRLQTGPLAWAWRGKDLVVVAGIERQMVDQPLPRLGGAPRPPE